VPDLELGIPWSEFNVGSPERADKDESLLLAIDALGPREPEQVAGKDLRTCLFSHLAA
jgi:hypothetical protein